MKNMTRREVLAGSAAATAGLTLGAVEPVDAKANAKKKKKLLIAGAHPDDPESACGGLMALYAEAGYEVVSLYLTRGEAGIPGKSHDEAARIRTDEAEQACKIIGSRPVFLTQIDGSTEVNAQRYDEARAALEKEAPDIVATHWPIDTHRDHRVISMLVYDAWLHMKRGFQLYYFEVELGDQTQVFTPTHYIDITAVAGTKKDACYCHKSQNAEDGFYVLHQKMHEIRGQECGAHDAEAYIRHWQNRATSL
jgi:LmbE family N-acetylglucosaminyl deacetylase